ncbi:MAG: hypothetical protein R3E88_07205 [Myxococcota bacterium]
MTCIGGRGRRFRRLAVAGLAALVAIGCSPSDPEPAATPTDGALSFARSSTGYERIAGEGAGIASAAPAVRDAASMPGWPGVLRFTLVRATRSEPCSAWLTFDPASIGAPATPSDPAAGTVPDALAAGERATAMADRVRLQHGEAGTSRVGTSGGIVQGVTRDAATGIEEWQIAFICSFWDRLPRDLELQIRSQDGLWTSFPLSPPG